MNDKTKNLGQVWTPDVIVDVILDKLDYSGLAVLSSRILEPSFGEGVFLRKIIDRIVEEGNKQKLSLDKIASLIETQVHGIEIDPIIYTQTKNDLITEAKNKYGLEVKLPNLLQMDALDYQPKQQFDFIVGNPPYVRIHNLSPEMREKIKQYAHSTGTTDLYIIFYELGLKWLNDKGALGYIAPNSWLRNSSQKAFRSMLIKERLLKEISNYGSVDVFPKISTYTCITILDKKTTETLLFSEMSELTQEDFSVSISLDNIDTSKPFSFFSKPDHTFVMNHTAKNKTEGLQQKYRIQNGLATLADKSFLINPDSSLIEKYPHFIKPVVKGSRYKGEKITQYILFPYVEEDGRFIGIKEKALPKEILDLFLKNKEVLNKRSLERGSEWFWYGRSQAIQETNKRKLVISPIVHPSNTLKAFIVPAETLVYSGLFLTALDENDTLEEAQKIIMSTNFAKYARLRGKDMSGGYKNINTGIIKEYKA